MPNLMNRGLSVIQFGNLQDGTLEKLCLGEIIINWLSFYASYCVCDLVLGKVALQNELAT